MFKKTPTFLAWFLDCPALLEEDVEYNKVEAQDLTEHLAEQVGWNRIHR